MSDEKAKAVQEVAKTTGQFISAGEKTGSFFSRIFGDGIEAKYGKWADDKIAERHMNRIDLALKVQSKLDDAGIENIRALPIKVGFPLIEAASLENDPDIQEMFANLLASALNPAEDEIEKKYVTVLSDISASEATLITFLYSHKYTENPYPGFPKVSWGVKQFRTFKLSELKRYTDSDEDDVRSLMRLGILKSIPLEMKLDFDSSNRSLAGRGRKSTKFGVYSDTEQTSFTPFGIDFITRVIDGKSVINTGKAAERKH